MPSESAITVTSWRSLEKGASLKGFLTLTMMESGLVVRDCSLHQRDDGTRWIGLPARQYTKDGETLWARTVDFATKESYSHFQKASHSLPNLRASPRQTINRYFKSMA